MTIHESTISRLILAASVLGLAVFAATARYGGLSWGFIAAVLILVVPFEFFFLFRRQRPINPYLILWLSPLLLLQFSTIGDFRVRLICFILLAYVFGAAHAGGRPRRWPFPKHPALVWQGVLCSPSPI